jgi:hypothetical protein
MENGEKGAIEHSTPCKGQCCTNGVMESVKRREKGVVVLHTQGYPGMAGRELVASGSAQPEARRAAARSRARARAWASRACSQLATRKRAHMFVRSQPSRKQATSNKQQASAHVLILVLLCQRPLASSVLSPQRGYGRYSQSK